MQQHVRKRRPRNTGPDDDEQLEQAVKAESQPDQSTHGQPGQTGTNLEPCEPLRCDRHTRLRELARTDAEPEPTQQAESG